MRLAFTLVTLMFALLASQAHAILEIEITKGVQGAIPIAVAPFNQVSSASSEGAEIASIVAADLARSGFFEVIPETRFPQRVSNAAAVNHTVWRSEGIENVVLGKIVAQGGGSSKVEFQLLDTVRGRQAIGYSIPLTSQTLRKVAHKISDLIFEQLTGIQGAFSTRIAYISTLHQEDKDKRRYVLQVADSDGFNARTIFSSQKQLLSPAWSPDGRQIAYVSFENNRSEIFVQDLVTGNRRRVSSKPGINSAPAWSPNGRELALTLSVDGNTEIYILNVSSGEYRRLTNSPSIDTEPRWVAGGRELIFTSDRAGRPQLYRASVRGGKATRLTYEGRYNADADISRDGQFLTMVHNNGQGFRIAVMDLDTGSLNVLTRGTLDEAPSFAPNGSMIIYATEERGRGVLSAVSRDGRVQQRLRLEEGSVREPVWSPLIN